MSKLIAILVDGGGGVAVDKPGMKFVYAQPLSSELFSITI